MVINFFLNFLLILTFTFNANKIVIIIILLGGWDAWISLYLLLSNKNIVLNIGHKKQLQIFQCHSVYKSSSTLSLQ